MLHKSTNMSFRSRILMETTRCMGHGSANNCNIAYTEGQHLRLWFCFALNQKQKRIFPFSELQIDQKVDPKAI